MEQTGREILWPYAVELIFSSPFVTAFGVGEPNVAMDVYPFAKPTTPHNAFLHFALSSGFVPFALFLAFFIRAAWKSIHAVGQETDAFRVPLLLFTFVAAMFGDTPYMSPWALLAISIAAGPPLAQGRRRFVTLRAPHRADFGTGWLVLNRPRSDTASRRHS
jgi:O-antigen ligase